MRSVSVVVLRVSYVIVVIVEAGASCGELAQCEQDREILLISRTDMLCVMLSYNQQLI